jgi:hypothetical protein
MLHDAALTVCGGMPSQWVSALPEADVPGEAQLALVAGGAYVPLDV